MRVLSERAHRPQRSAKKRLVANDTIMAASEIAIMTK
jgi:hypothetical protein